MIDDVLVFGRAREEHDVRLNQGLFHLAEAGVTLNKNKCLSGVSEVAFLGVIVSTQGIRPEPGKVAAIMTMEAPKDVEGVRRLLGMINHLVRFLPHISDITAPMRALLNKTSSWTWQHEQEAAFVKVKEILTSDRCTWQHEQEAAFPKVKEILTSDRCMAKYDPSYATNVSADASSVGLGAVLLQTKPSGERRLVDFASRAAMKQSRDTAKPKRKLWL